MATSEKKLTKLARLRQKRGYSCQDIANALTDKDFRIDPATVYRVERGEQTPKQETARRLFRFWRDQGVRISLGSVYDPTYEIDHAG